jgi:hypothetical protein
MPGADPGDLFDRVPGRFDERFGTPDHPLPRSTGCRRIVQPGHDKVDGVWERDGGRARGNKHHRSFLHSAPERIGILRLDRLCMVA